MSQMILQYLLKFSISLAVLYIFYRAVLRPLTFYQCNRFYLLGYSSLSFAVPFINLAPWVKTASSGQLINSIPAIGNYKMSAGNSAVMQSSLSQQFTVTLWLLLFFSLGAAVVLVKVVHQYLSLRRIRNQSILLNSHDRVKLYQTSASVSPFSFGNAIYFNNSLHAAEELQRIIEHEFVHVRQKHSVDIMVGELLCIVNWFNPFAWMIRHAIRQNAEFIADHAVVTNGMDKKEYQYLLLKVVGISQYSIASNFNLSNLKKRIIMMNKIKSARLHVIRFLFVLPLLTITLLAFRNRAYPATGRVTIAGIVVNVVTLEPLVNAAIYCKEKNVTVFTDRNGYYFLQLPADKNPIYFTLRVTKGGYGSFYKTATWVNKSIALFGLGKGLKDNNGFSVANNMDTKEALGYGAVLLKLNAFKNRTQHNKQVWGDTVPALPQADTRALPPGVSNIASQQRVNKKQGTDTYVITVTLLNGTKDRYNINDPKQKAAYIKKYGALPEPVMPAEPIAPVPGIDAIPPVPPVPVVDTVPAADGRAGSMNKNSMLKSDFEEDQFNMAADSIVFNKNLLVFNGTFTIKGKENTVNGSIALANTDEMPLIVYNGNEVTDINAFKVMNARFSLWSLHAKQGVAKYGDKAKYGVLEITRLADN